MVGRKSNLAQVRTQYIYCQRRVGVYVCVCVCVCVCVYVRIRVCMYIQSVTGGTDQTSGGCSLC